MGPSNATTLLMDYKIIERLIPIDPRFKNRRLPTTLQKHNRGSLEIHFVSVRTIQAKKIIQTCLFSVTDFGHHS